MPACAILPSVWRRAALGLLWALVTACGGEKAATPTGGDTGADAQSPGDGSTGSDSTVDASTAKAPSPEFAPFCQSVPWQETVEPGVVGELHGDFKGVLSGLGPNLPFGKGSAETMKIVPQHPFRVTAIRAAFAKGTGPVKLRLQRAWGRSYPGLWPKSKDESLDVIMELMQGRVVTKKTDWFDLREARLQYKSYSQPMMEMAVASSRSPTGARSRVTRAARPCRTCASRTAVGCAASRAIRRPTTPASRRERRDERGAARRGRGPLDALRRAPRRAQIGRAHV